jgi:integrase
MVLIMNKFVILFLLTTLLLAKNPNVYAALGDVIYDNAIKIEKIRTIVEDDISAAMIDKYLADVKKAKDDGFKIEAGKSVDKKTYLNELRELSKTNDFFIRYVYKRYKKALKEADSWLFSQMVNSGLMDTQKYKDEIIEYYMTHSDVMDTEGIIRKYLDEYEQLKVQQKAPKVKVTLTKEEIQRARIERLRRNDKLKQEAIKKSLEEEVAHEKSKIREEQIKELSK